MTPEPLIVDSSVWIAVLRDAKDVDAQVLHHLVEQCFAHTTGVIRVEILPFVQESQREKTEVLFQSLPAAEQHITRDLWSGAVHWRTRAVQAGLHDIALPDVLIATVALEASMPVWSRDKHFRRLADQLPLRLWSPA